MIIQSVGWFRKFGQRNIPDKKKCNTYISTLRKITSDEAVAFISVRRYVSYCCITHHSQPEVKNVLKKINHKPSGGQIVKSYKKRFYNALLLD